MIEISKDIIKKYVSSKEVLITIFVVIASVVLGANMFLRVKRDVIVNDDGTIIEVTTARSTVKGVLAQNKIEINSDDYISVGLDSKLHKTKVNNILIKRAVPVNITINGEDVQIMTYENTVGEAIKTSGLNLASNYRIEGADYEQVVEPDMSFAIVKIKEAILSEREVLPYELINKPNRSMDKGHERVIEHGSEGIVEKTFRVILEDGVEVGRNILNKAVLSTPVNKVIEYGTIASHQTSRGDVFRYTDVLDVRATSYTASFEDTGKHPDHPQFGITFTGIRARRGIIAVDPNVIPLGTRVYIEVPGPTPDYGYALAADIGSAIRGNKIDLYVEDRQTALNWGVRPVRVYILKD